MKHRIASTTQLRSLAQAAEDMDLNQYPSERLWQDIDPEGVHVLSGLLPHSDHYRSMWLVKLRDTDEPARVLVDTTHELLQTLTGETSVASG